MAGWMKEGEVKDDRKQETEEEERTNKSLEIKVEERCRSIKFKRKRRGGHQRDYGIDGEALRMDG